MNITGRVITSTCTSHNQVTLEGAQAVVNCLLNNEMNYITNILFITSQSSIDAIYNEVRENIELVNWKMIETLYNKEVYAYTSSSSTSPSYGQITKTTQLQEDEQRVLLRCDVLFDVGTIPADFIATPPLALLLVLNGNTSTPQFGVKPYEPTGNEKVLAYIKLVNPLQMNSEEATKFTWEIYVSVKAE